MDKYIPLTISEETEASIKKLAEEFNFQPYTEDGYISVSPKVYGDQSQLATVTMGQLIDSKSNETIKQADVDNTRVMALLGLTNKGSVSNTHKPTSIIAQGILEPLSLAMPNEVLDSGRHRLRAILTLFTALGLDVNSEEFRNSKIRVLQVPYNVQRFAAANKTRSVKPTEKANINLQAVGVNTEDADSLIKAVSEGLKKEALPLLFVKLTEGSDLTELTRAQIATTVVSRINKAVGYRKVLAANPALYTQVFGILADHLPEAVNKTLKAGHTNMALAKADIAEHLIRIAGDEYCQLLNQEHTSLKLQEAQAKEELQEIADRKAKAAAENAAKQLELEETQLNTTKTVSGVLTEAEREELKREEMKKSARKSGRSRLPKAVAK